MVVAKHGQFDHNRFLLDFQKSDCYWPPLTLEDAKEDTFLETTFRLQENNLRFWSNEGQVFKGGESLAADGEQHTGRAARAEGWCERYRGPPDHQIRRSECYRPTLVDELWSAVSSQQTLVAFMTCAGMEEMSIERVTRALS